MYRLIVFTTLFCLMFSLSAFGQTPAVVNPSFEEGEDTPVFWKTLTSYPYDYYLWDKEVFHSGKRSISIRQTSFNYGRWKSEKSPVSQEGYMWYTMTGYVKTQNNMGEVYLSIAWYGKDSKLITTSDSEMLPGGNNDWQSATVSALPPYGSVQMELWCVSNNNGGQTWFDDISLTTQQLSARQKGASGNPADTPYDQFINEYPKHPLTTVAHDMRLRSLYTRAKWMKERSYHYPDDRAKAVELFAQTAAVPRMDNVLSQNLPQEQLAPVQRHYEKIVDTALFQASICSLDYASARSYLEQIIRRNQTPEMVEEAQKRIEFLNRVSN